MTKVLVTGATGFVGRSLIPYLMKNGHTVRAVVRKKSDFIQCEQLEVADIAKYANWKTVLSDIEVIIHLAARVHIMKDESTSPLDEYCKVNTETTKRLATEAEAAGVKRFIYLSSIKVNGEYSINGQPFTEKSKPQPLDDYALSKYYAEQFLQFVSGYSKLEYVILRPPLIIGPEVKANFLKILQLVSKGLPLPFKGIDNSRSFISLDNLLSAINLVIQHPKAANQVYLVADDGAWSMSNLIKEIGLKLEKKTILFKVPGLKDILKLIGLGLIQQRIFASLEVENSKIKKELGWVPPIRTQDGLAKTIAWYKNEYNT